MKTEIMYIIVDRDGEWTSTPRKDETGAWIAAIGDLDRMSHFKRAGYRCVEVTVTLNEERHDKD